MKFKDALAWLRARPFVMVLVVVALVVAVVIGGRLLWLALAALVGALALGSRRPSSRPSSEVRPGRVEDLVRGADIVEARERDLAAQGDAAEAAQEAARATVVDADAQAVADIFNRDARRRESERP